MRRRTVLVGMGLLLVGALLPAQTRPAEDDVSGIAVQDLRANDSNDMRYFLIGPDAQQKQPPDGYRLLVVMPGGDGGETFNPFVRRIWRRALPEGFLVAQPVAKKWTATQQVVWPTTRSAKDQAFTTQEFVVAVIADVQKRHKVDRQHIYSLSWSSSGPAAYAMSLDPNSPVTGSFIAMSVFKPGQLPPLTSAAGRPYYLLHSPDDRVCPYAMAVKAESSLRENGAKVKLVTYEGGHGWRGDVFSTIRAGIDWLMVGTAEATSQRSGAPATNTASQPDRSLSR